MISALLFPLLLSSVGSVSDLDVTELSATVSPPMKVATLAAHCNGPFLEPIGGEWVVVVDFQVFYFGCGDTGYSMAIAFRNNPKNCNTDTSNPGDGKPAV
ncbi:MAG: hypothetical protein FWG02_07105 [Holophagaceae bacterium]|nr:hypothetical protein [Holophagaceae bacterium]